MKKRLLSFIIAMVMVLTLLPVTAITASAAGATINVGNKAQLLEVAKNLLRDKDYYEGDTIRLTADINLAGEKWMPVNMYNATFDGNSKTISNLKIECNHDCDDCVCGCLYCDEYGVCFLCDEDCTCDCFCLCWRGDFGLFAWLENSIVKNLTLTNPVIDVESYNEWVYAGAVAAYAEGSQIRNVVVNNPTINVSGYCEGVVYLGGVVGYTDWFEYYDDVLDDYVDVINIINGAEVYGGSITFSGGLAGYYDGGHYEHGAAVYMGGIAGANYVGSIGNAAVYGTKLSIESPPFNADNPCGFCEYESICGECGECDCVHCYFVENSNIYIISIGGIAGYTSLEERPLEACIINTVAAGITISLPVGLTGEHGTLLGGLVGWVNEDVVVNNVYIGGLELFGKLDKGIYKVDYNHKYATAAAAKTDKIVTKLNDKTPTTGGFWVAASEIVAHMEDETNYAFDHVINNVLKPWFYKTVPGITGEVPAFDGVGEDEGGGGPGPIVDPIPTPPGNNTPPSGGGNNTPTTSTGVSSTDEWGNKLIAFDGKYENLVNVFLNGKQLVGNISNNGEQWDLFKDSSTDYGYGSFTYTDSIGKAYSGSTLVLLYADFLKSLPGGVYTISVLFADGSSASMDFEIEGGELEENPGTGVTISVTAMLVSGAVAVLARKRRV
ncbi:MAG: hypothetical protein FWD34_05375 [Oscillospiraceae bacterium]|nr:hypothetical protein [Oscillospiraceae bacterium]